MLETKGENNLIGGTNKCSFSFCQENESCPSKEIKQRRIHSFQVGFNEEAQYV